MAGSRFADALKGDVGSIGVIPGLASAKVLVRVVFLMRFHLENSDA
jgi:hypothetical protein